ncbi:hypothetical protein H8D30_03620 [bacterium]|nr:hypothetical protein [bacterium]
MIEQGVASVFDRVHKRGNSTLVFDADVLIKLEKGGHLSVLTALQKAGLRTVTTKSVGNEIRSRKQKDALVGAGLEIINFRKVDPEATSLFRLLRTKALDLGEATVFAVAQHFGFAVVTDDVLAKVAYVEYQTPIDDYKGVLSTEQILEDFIDTEFSERPRSISILGALHLARFTGVEIERAWQPSPRRWWRAGDISKEITGYKGAPDVLVEAGVGRHEIGWLASDVRHEGNPLGLEIKSTREAWGASLLARPLFSYLAQYGQVGHQYNFIARSALRKYAWEHPKVLVAMADARKEWLGGGGDLPRDIPRSIRVEDRYDASLWAQRFVHSFNRLLIPYDGYFTSAPSCPAPEVEERASQKRPPCHCTRVMGLRTLHDLTGPLGRPIRVAEYHCQPCDHIEEWVYRIT